MSRITERFAKLKESGKMGLVAYITAGDPSLDQSLEYVLDLERAGTDLIELGVPFSDPLADGAVIQRASERALRAGTTVDGILAMVRKLREKSQIPIVIFTYLNPLMRYGYPRFSSDAAAAGADGVLLTDLSVEEAGPFVAESRRAGLDTIFLAAPTSTDRRLRMIAECSTGFVYAVSRTGVTGTRDTLSNQLLPLVERLRAVTSLPIAAGFGISTAAQMDELRGKVDAAVVGSALVRVVEERGNLEEMVRRLKNGNK